MPTDPVTRAFVVAETTLLGALRGTGGLGLAGAALAFPLLVLAIASGNFNGLDLLSAAETLFSTLFLPVVLGLVCLVQGVSLFRTELEDDTLLYPMKRTVPRPSVVVGKYLGFLASTLLALLPSALIGFAIAAALGHGPTQPSVALTEAIVLLTTLGVVAYGAIFLLLGLLTRSALVIGLVYGFLWETFISLIPGPISQWTVVYYLRSIGTSLLPSVNWGGGAPTGSVPGTTAGIVLFAVGCLVVASAYLRYTEIRPAAAPT
jgi:ABC-2 type transport system permease protein